MFTPIVHFQQFAIFTPLRNGQLIHVSSVYGCPTQLYDARSFELVHQFKDNTICCASALWEGDYFAHAGYKHGLQFVDLRKLEQPATKIRLDRARALRWLGQRLYLESRSHVSVISWPVL